MNNQNESAKCCLDMKKMLALVETMVVATVILFEDDDLLNAADRLEYQLRSIDAAQHVYANARAASGTAYNVEENCRTFVFKLRSIAMERMVGFLSEDKKASIVSILTDEDFINGFALQLAAYHQGEFQ